MKTIFPEQMLSIPILNLDSIKAKLSFFELQTHELHWQTTSFAEHKLLDEVYNKIFDLKDNVVEKIMGYTGMRTKAMPVEPIKNYSSGITNQIITELSTFAKQLEEYANSNNMPDVEALAQDLSGVAAKAKYLLTLS